MAKSTKSEVYCRTHTVMTCFDAIDKNGRPIAPHQLAVTATDLPTLKSWISQNQPLVMVNGHSYSVCQEGALYTVCNLPIEQDVGVATSSLPVEGFRACAKLTDADSKYHYMVLATDSSKLHNWRKLGREHTPGIREEQPNAFWYKSSKFSISWLAKHIPELKDYERSIKIIPDWRGTEKYRMAAPFATPPPYSELSK
ncbi:hypothetical protein BJY04DRAFT_224020 [Aspergillus karnatakaensis]|uniref:uncharacterized protein n=1 Tax=Aspergillus karnatakaensis TaxID=1810916 RepID=UPI003CCCE875